MTPEGLEILRNAHELSDMNYRFLSLGYFLDAYARSHDLAPEVSNNIPIPLGKESIYIVSANLIKEMLTDLHNKPNAMSLLNYMILFNVLRGVSGAVREAIGDGGTKDLPGQVEVRSVFENDIFKGNKNDFEEFDGIIRLIRNVLSHNISDRIVIHDKNIKEQRNYWLNKKKKHSMCFKYSYTQPGASIRIDGYNAKCDISIDWHKVNRGTLFGDLAPSLQYFMLIEFCHNALNYLSGKYK